MLEIQHRVLNELHFDLAIPRDRLTVNVLNGYVILSGEVERPYQKSCAEMDARRVPGVSVVINDIIVAGTPSTSAFVEEINDGQSYLVLQGRRGHHGRADG